MTAYLRYHAQALAGTLAGFARAPFATLLTVAVIGITLALPTGLYLTVDNVTRLAGGWDSGGRLSLFLKAGVSDDAAKRLATRLRRAPGIAQVDYVDRDQALAEFKQHSGFGDAVTALGENPLPATLLVRLGAGHQDAATIERLARELGREDEVAEVLVDLDWVRRLQAWLGLIERGVWLLAALLALAVLIIIGNTVRLAVLNRRDEIVIIKLVGGSNAFIRRPFLYSGILQGLAGGLLACGLVLGGFWLLGEPIADLTRLYGSGFGVETLGPAGALLLTGAGGLLGWFGTRLAVGRHLRAIEPT